MVAVVYVLLVSVFDALRSVCLWFLVVVLLCFVLVCIVCSDLFDVAFRLLCLRWVC